MRKAFTGPLATSNSLLLASVIVTGCIYCIIIITNIQEYIISNSYVNITGDDKDQNLGSSARNNR